MVDVVLATGQVMPHGAETETPLVVAALADRGVTAVIEPWGSADAARAGLVVVRTTWDYPSRLEEFLRWVRATAAATQLVNSAGVIEWNSHKSYLLDLAYSAVPVIPTTLVSRGSSDTECRESLAEFDREVVIKPAVSVGAIGAVRAPAGSAEATDHLRLLAASGDALVQPYEPAIIGGEVSLIYFGEEYSHAVRKIPATGDYRVQEFLGGSIEPHTASAEERGVAVAALAAVDQPVTCARVDLVTTAGGPVLMELELIEPQLFLDSDGVAAGHFADHLLDRLRSR
jgi:glutathione synthase/RimK-type ligase-like ATP-grasp enzyme